MRRLRANIDVRGYAASHDVRLGDIARWMGISESTFSTAYMKLEMPDERKELIKRMIDEIARDRDDACRVQEA